MRKHTWTGLVMVMALGLSLTACQQLNRGAQVFVANSVATGN